MRLPDSTQLTTLQRFGLALVLNAMALLIQQWVFSVCGNRFMFFFVAVLFCAWFCGFWPGLVTGLVGGAAALWWLRPEGPLVVTPFGNAVILLLYIVVCVVL